MTELVKVVAGQAELVLAPALGGGLVSWTRAEEPIFRLPLPGALEEDTPRNLGSYPLFPYSNRVGGRRFSFAGRSYELPDLMRGWAIHGAGWQLPWTATEADGKVTLSLDYPGGRLWPFAFHAEQIFALSEDALDMELVIRNLHSAPAPAGFGQHPFFPRTAAQRLTFTATGVQMAGADMIPTHMAAVPAAWDHSKGLPIGQYLDHCFTGWTGHARLDYPDRGFAIDITADPVFGALVVYVPEGQPFMAVEPVSNITDGLNHMQEGTAHGVFVLRPGEEKRGKMRFAVSAI